MKRAILRSCRSRQIRVDNVAQLSGEPLRSVVLAVQHEEHGLAVSRIVGKIHAKPAIPAVFTGTAEGDGAGRIYHYPVQIAIAVAGKPQPVVVIALLLIRELAGGEVTDGAGTQNLSAAFGDAAAHQHAGKAAIVIQRREQAGTAGFKGIGIACIADAEMIAGIRNKRCTVLVTFVLV